MIRQIVNGKLRTVNSDHKGMIMRTTACFVGIFLFFLSALAQVVLHSRSEIFSFAAPYTDAAACDVVINEIMFDPLSGQKEWFEIYNRTGSAVSLNGWSFHDRRTASGRTRTCRLSCTFQPESFLCIAADSSLLKLYSFFSDDQYVILNQAGFSFNNDSDAVVLCDASGKTIDSVAYSANWHNPGIRDVSGRSLERIDPDGASNPASNWGTCSDPAGGTPGRANSLFRTFSKPKKSIRLSQSFLTRRRWI